MVRKSVRNFYHCSSDVCRKLTEGQMGFYWDQIYLHQNCCFYLEEEIQKVCEGLSKMEWPVSDINEFPRWNNHEHCQDLVQQTKSPNVPIPDVYLVCWCSVDVTSLSFVHDEDVKFCWSCGSILSEIQSFWGSHCSMKWSRVSNNSFMPK